MGDVNTIRNIRKSIPASLAFKNSQIEKPSDIYKPDFIKLEKAHIFCNESTVSTSPKSVVSVNSNISNKKTIRIPVLIKPPFLYRNHAAYKILSINGTIKDIKDVVSVETRMECIRIRKMCRRKPQNGSKLENSIVRIKKRILEEFHSEGKWAKDILVFEFFKIVSNVDVFKKAYCDIFICGVLNGVTRAKRERERMGGKSGRRTALTTIIELCF
uniref:Ribosomal protein S3 n=1 Tax=Panagrolaimus superbus TaxID=310955 RepID=A0A914YB64_9BILA